MRLTPANIPAGLLLAALLPLSGCNVQDPGQGPIVLHLSLHDSLSRYDSVRIVIADAAHPESDLETVRSGPLATPSSIPAYTLTKAKDPFVVKVRGFRGNNQLALETHIYYEGGRKRVVYQGVPPQVPYNWLSRLTPSAGTLNPVFSLDQLAYTLTLPPNTASIHFDVKSAYDRAVTTVAGDTVKVGVPAKVFPVGSEDFTVPIAVTDLGTPRTYQVTVKPVNVKARLDSVWFSAGALEKPFDPENYEITLILPAGVNTVNLKFWTTDDATTALYFTGDRIFPGVTRTVTLSGPADVELATVVVQKSDTNKFEYSLTVKH